jgi:hypothetical protein
MLSKRFKFIWAIIAPLPGRLWLPSGWRLSLTQSVNSANPLYSHLLNQWRIMTMLSKDFKCLLGIIIPFLPISKQSFCEQNTGKSLMRNTNRLSVYIIVLFIALFLTILSPLQAATYDWSSLGGDDSAGIGSGFETVGGSPDNPLVVSNIFTQDGSQMYPDNTTPADLQQVILQAGSDVCSFEVQQMRFKGFKSSTQLATFEITFKDSNDIQLENKLLLSSPPVNIENTVKTLDDIFGSFTPVKGVSKIELIIEGASGIAPADVNFVSIDLANVAQAPCAPTTDPEPTNYPTSFTATANTSSKITTSWTDSTGTQLPAGYLVMCNTSDSFTAPVDKTDDTDYSGGGVQNIAQGTQSAEWTSLNSGTQYYFKVYPYTNSGSDIDYKTDGTPPTANATTLQNVVYVSSTGSDGGDGSSGNPYLTLTKGIQQVADGGTVNIVAGTYTETTMITIGKNVTITGDSTTSTIIDGGNSHRSFDIAFGNTVEMNYLTVRNGKANNDDGNGNDGGGIQNWGTLTLNNSTISGNDATTAGGAFANAGTLTLNNSTISGNTTTGTGGGIRNTGGGTVTLNNTTVSNNTAGNGGGINNVSGTLTLNDSLVVGNTSNDNQDVTGTIDTNTTSHVGNGGTITWLAALADNGGLTQTHALLTGAPNTVISAGSSCLTNDQRGITRATACDVGAYETSKISIVAGTTPTEAGFTAGSYTITLSPQLPSNQTVTVNYSTSGTATHSVDYDIGGTDPNISIINAGDFTIDGGSTGVTSVTLEALVEDDSIDDDAETVKITLTSANNGYIIAPGSENATLTITDDDTKGFTVNPTSGLVTTESGGTATFTVKLNSQPTADVTIGLSSDNINEGTVAPSSLTFKPTGIPLWSEPQTVTITGANDTSPATDGNIGYNIVTAAASGGDYDTMDPADVSVTNNDNDTPEITVNPTTLTVSEPAGNGTFTIKLNTQPSSSAADVTISSIAASNGECSVSPTSTTIANANWNTGTTFTVTAQNDDVIDGNQTCTIQIGTSTSGDDDYNSLDPTDVTVTVQDDDSATPTPAPSPPSTMTLSVKYAGNGAGKVTSEPTGIDCHNDNAPCEQTFDTGTNVTLTPVANVGSEFLNFTGDSDCQKDEMVLTSDITCTANFQLVTGIGSANCPEATLVYVNPNATEGSGCSWDSPFTDLQSVLIAIAEGSLPNVTEIWLHAGTYKPTTGENRQATFKLINGVSIYGGFSGYETDLNQRNSSEHQTILSGDIGIVGNNNDNSIHVVTGRFTNATAQLHDVTILGGNADESDVCPEACGGGIYIDNGSPSLEHLFVQGNSAIYGGGLYSGNGSSPLVKESMINNNSAQYGGGLFNDNSTPVIKHVFITGNTASHQGGGMLNQNQANAVLSHVNLSGNSAVLGGGMLNDKSAPVVSHSILSDNEAKNGGGLVNMNMSEPLLSHAIISGNAASETGGAILNRDSAPVISQTTITENIASNGSGIVNENSPITVNNSLLWENHRQDAQVVEAQIVDDLANPSAVNYSIIQGGWIGLGEHNLAEDPLFAEQVTDSISTHTWHDFHLKAGSPAIDAGSNALIPIDKADAECADGFGDGNTTEPIDVDFDGRTRIVDGNNDGTATVDMGTYEVQSVTTPVYSLTVSKTGNGQGNVSSNKAGINCGTDCRHDYISDTPVNLISRTEPGSIFAGWRGACSGIAGSFMVIMNEPKQCDAQFDLTSETTTPTVPTSSGSSGGGAACSTFSGTVDANCNAGGQTVTDLDEIEEGGQVANAIIDRTITSKGWLSNVTIRSEGIVSGGFATGYTKVEGYFENFEFRGASVSGLNEAGEVQGKIGGKVILASQVGGIVEDVRLAPDTQIVGSGKPSVGSQENIDRIGGTIIGDSKKPATLERVHIRTKSRVSNAIIQENVTYDEGVTFTNVEFRTKVVRKVILKGRINGIRFKETYTRVESVTIRANSHLSNLEIGDNVTFEDGVTLDDSVTFSAHRKYRETHRIIVDIPNFNDPGAIDSQGNSVSTWARLQGGVRLVGSDGKPVGSYHKKVTIKRSQQKKVEILGNVLTDVRDIGKKADILAVAAYTSPDASSPSFYMFDNQGTPLPWNGVMSSLVPFQERTTLVPVVPLPIWNNPLDILGYVQVYIGYRLLETKTIVYSLEDVIEMTLTE